jgi:hypothetical protein
MSNIQIREFDKSDFSFYRECLSDVGWRKSYGEYEDPEDLDGFIDQRLRDYPFVKRYIFLDRDNRRVAFIIADFVEANSDHCIMSGGVSLDMIGKGYGVRCSVIFCNYIFKNYTLTQNIVAYYQNSFSERMLLKSGFLRHDSIHTQKNKLVLLRKQFPNRFCSQILG